VTGRETHDAHLPLGEVCDMTCSQPALADDVPRAGRFVIEVPIRFRPLGESEWRDGRTENISSSGVFFRVGEPLLPQTQIEMTFGLGYERGHGTGQVLCTGRIVRVVSPSDRDDGRAAVAASIRCYRLVRAQEVA
jgi:hypothetical protein